MTLLLERYFVIPLSGARGAASGPSETGVPRPREARATPPLAISLAVGGGSVGSDLVLVSYGGEPSPGGDAWRARAGRCC